MDTERRSEVQPQLILVVDDEQQASDIIMDALVSQGHRAESACDGIKALEIIQKGGFSIVITDMDMPRMDGMQLIQHLVNLHSDIDIIAITGHIMKYTYTEVVEAGASDFITKPFSLNELEAKLNRLIRERNLREQLALLAIRDPLTGLQNRRSFAENARKEAIRAVRYDHTLFLFFMDVDNFKHYNDQYGHQAGDTLLTETANLLTNSIRENIDSVYRYGGDEFIMLLPHLPVLQALSVAERICGNFDNLKLGTTSLSIGIAKFIQNSGSIDQDTRDMIQRADTALYEAKKGQGKDRVFIDKDSH